jgi:hypothetical protein
MIHLQAKQIEARTRDGGSGFALLPSGLHPNSIR